MDSSHIQAFREEAYDILTELESLLLELEEKPDDAGLIDRVFGSFHTIKGSGSMFGFDAISEFTHQIETVLDLVRDGLVPVSHHLIALTLSARDKILEMLDEDADALDDEAQVIVSGFEELCADDAPLQAESRAEETADQERKIRTFRIRFTPSPDLFINGANPLLLITELREMGECTVAAQTDNIPFLNEYDPEKCYTGMDIILTTDQDENAIRDVFIFVEDNCDLVIKQIFEHEYTEDVESYKPIGEILLDRGDITPDDLSLALAGHKKLGERLIEVDAVHTEKVSAALTEQEHLRKILRQEQNKKLASIRVDAGRLDNLVDLVGELVTVQARLTQKAAGTTDPELQLIAESVERLTEELRDNAMSIRMVPIGTLFARFKRLIHDLSNNLQKQVTMTTEGAATELDKTVIDQLNEPLVHIIRNAIDHGIESPAIRQSLGKPVKGTIQLSAYHTGASVLIDISDDGAGLDTAAIKAQAIDKGFVPADADLSESEYHSLILKPGFTMSDEVSDVSGRGVGMDVVRQSIDNLRGTIGITSRAGQGTTISLRLPLTLAIIDGLLVGIGSELFIIPLSVIDECIELNSEEAKLSRERSMMTFRGEMYPYISLRKSLGIGGETPDLEKVVLVDTHGKKIGLSVDLVIGQHQTVIKTLSRALGNVEGISGATILGDGTVALILDVNQLINLERDTAIH